MLSYGNDYSYAADRLVGSVVRKDGIPVYINEIDPDDGFTTFKVLGGVKWYEANLEGFNLEPMPLGYVNTYSGHLVYAMRLPARKFRQGLRADTFYCQPVGQAVKLRFDSPDLTNTVLNKFPTIEMCMEFIDVGEAINGKAFHRHWAISSKKKKFGNELLFMSRPVGCVELKHAGDMPMLKLEDKYKYLSEYLGEATNGK